MRDEKEERKKQARSNMYMYMYMYLGVIPVQLAHLSENLWVWENGNQPTVYTVHT